MRIVYGLIGIGLVALVAFAVGLHLGRGQTSKQAERVVYRDRIVTVTKTVKPDGTTIESTKTEDRNGTKQTTTTKQALAKYRLGGMLQSPYAEWKPEPIGTAGMRLIGPVWLDVQAGGKQAAIGLALEF